MPFPPSVLSAARAVQRDLKPEHAGFVSAQEPMIVGYVVGPGPHDINAAIGRPIEPLSGGQSCSVRLVPEPTIADLYWVQVSQSVGAILYTWQSGEHTYHYLALASDDPAHRRDMEGAAAANERRKLALMLRHETGMEFAMLMRLTRTVNGYNLAKLALGLAIWLITEAQDDIRAAQDRAERLTLMRNPDRLANLRGFQPASQHRTGDTLAHLCMGAKIVLASAKLSEA